jgi:uncharacterized protein
MTREFAPRRLDVNGFAEAAAPISGIDPLHSYERLSAELAAPAADLTVEWTAVGQRRSGADGTPVSWLHLTADAKVPLICQRCLTPVDVDLRRPLVPLCRRRGRRAAEDEEAEEDVLVASREFDLHALIEDELLMDIPVTPRHEVCWADEAP